MLCVSQFTLYGDARKGNRPVLRRGGAPRGGRAALRALRRSPRRGPRRVRRDDGGRAGQRRAGDAAARASVAFRRPMPPTIASSPASPPSRRRTPALRPLVADADAGVPGRLPADRQRGRGAGRARRGRLVPRPHLARAHVRAGDGPPDGGYELFGYVSSSPGGDGERARRLPQRRRLHGRDGRRQPRLADRPLRRGHRPLARRAGQGRRHDAGLGRARWSTAARWSPPSSPTSPSTSARCSTAASRCSRPTTTAATRST